MSMLDQLRKEKLEAYKNKDTVKNGVLSLLISAMSLKEKETHQPLTQEEEFAIIQKELKQTKESLAATPADRTDLIAQEEAKVAILESYLPKQMTLDEVMQAIRDFASQQGVEISAKNRGVLIKGVMAALQGRTDGKMVSEALGKLLQ